MPFHLVKTQERKTQDGRQRRLVMSGDTHLGTWEPVIRSRYWRLQYPDGKPVETVRAGRIRPVYAVGLQYLGRLTVEAESILRNPAPTLAEVRRLAQEAALADRCAGEASRMPAHLKEYLRQGLGGGALLHEVQATINRIEKGTPNV